MRRRNSAFIFAAYATVFLLGTALGTILPEANCLRIATKCVWNCDQCLLCGSDPAVTTCHEPEGFGAKIASFSVSTPECEDIPLQIDDCWRHHDMDCCIESIRPSLRPGEVEVRGECL